MSAPSPDLLEILGAAPHWQTAVLRAQSLARTDTRAAQWVQRFVGRAEALVAGAAQRSPTRSMCTEGRFAVGSAGVAMPPELTSILRAALASEGPVLRAAVFLLVGAAVRAPLVPEGVEVPWDTYEKLRMISKALPADRRDRWCDALPRTVDAASSSRPSALAGRRLIAQGFSGDDITPAADPGLPPSASIDLLLSALTFRICTELADRAISGERDRAA